MSIHATADGTLERQEDGWFEARCVCGFAQGPLPDLETVVDELMDHARVSGSFERAGVVSPTAVGGTDD